MIDTIFFDFNGTIINDVELCLNILNKMLIDDEKKPITKKRYLEIFDFPVIEYYKKAGFDFKRKSFEEMSLDFINLYQKASLNCPLYNNSCKVFQRLKAKGIKLVILSASQIDNLKEQTNHFNITKYFDDILGITDIYARSKVDIGIDYINRLNIDKAKTIMLGDTIHDFEVATKMEITPVLFTKGHQSKERLSKMGSRLVSSYLEFERLVEEANENNY